MTLTENLNVLTFRNGDLIPEAKTKNEWIQAGRNKQPAWCYYDNKPENGEKYGKLYNWYAVNDPRGLAPEGYHIPTKEEMEAFQDEFLNGLSGGYRFYDGYYYYIEATGFWWGSTELDSDDAWYSALNYSSSNVYLSSNYKEYGFSVRCINNYDI